MAILKKDLLSLQREFRAVEKKMAMLLKAVENSGQSPKADTKKVVKGKSVKAKTAKKAAIKKAAASKKATQVTATDQILRIIKRFKKGVDVPTLKDKTGFDDKKVRNIVFRASKEGKIKKSGRGIYVGV
ncbi:MAG: hypothetical protein PVH42_19080 [Desulfobacterales bacterium]|jgi:hypothetical protein